MSEPCVWLKSSAGTRFHLLIVLLADLPNTKVLLFTPFSVVLKLHVSGIGLNVGLAYVWNCYLETELQAKQSPFHFNLYLYHFYLCRVLSLKWIF